MCCVLCVVCGVLLGHVSFLLSRVHVVIRLLCRSVCEEAVRGGRLVLRRWGRSSLYEPDKVAQIYAFDSSYISSDAVSFSQSMPGFLVIGVLCCLAALIIAMLPASAEIFFALGGGSWAGIPQLHAALCTCALGGALTSAVSVCKVLRG